MRILLLTLLIAASGFGQDKFNHVQWTAGAVSDTTPGSTIVVKLNAKIDPEWHMYSLTTPPGPTPTTIKLNHPTVAKVVYYQQVPLKKFDESLKTDSETFEGETAFLAQVTLRSDVAAGPITLTFEPRYQTCSGVTCIPPRTRQIPVMLNVKAGAVAVGSLPAGFTEAKVASLKAGAPAQESDLPSFLLLAFGFGLAAIFTPCVFPMIPITMSYFVGQKGGIGQAVVFCLGIVVLFTGLGLLATIFLGPAGATVLASSPWVNGFISLVFFVFGLSLLGAFEITIPSGLLTKLNDASGQGGFIGTLLMGLTFALASFACVGPFMGTLLAASVSGGKLRPVLGMATFASGLSLPFFFLALFPKYLKQMPRSGEWLSRVKVVMGFFVLAAMFKYLYSLDAVLQTGLLTRERFLAAWIVIFATAGLYLLGHVRLPGVSNEGEMGVGRLLCGLAFVVFGVSLLPGMFGGRLGEIEGYIPPPGANSVSAGGGAASTALVWIENDLAGALAKAKAEGKMVLVNFTGYACTNCHWMKANMFPRPEINGVMKNMILVDLYTDGTDAASVANQKLEEEKFKTVAIPFYVLYDGEGNVVATFPSLTRNPEEFLAFLNTKSAAPVSSAKTDVPGAPFKTLEGTPLSMDSWKGKVVVVNYWATWCIPCRKEVPEFNKMQKELGAKGVMVVGISMDEDGAAPVREFLKQNPMDYTVGLGSGTFDELPVTVVMDRAGNTVKKFSGFTKPEDIRAAIDKAL